MSVVRLLPGPNADGWQPLKFVDGEDREFDGDRDYKYFFFYTDSSRIGRRVSSSKYCLHDLWDHDNWRGSIIHVYQDMMMYLNMAVREDSVITQLHIIADYDYLPLPEDCRCVRTVYLDDADIEMYAPAHIKAAYANFTNEEKNNFRERLLHEMCQTFEEGDDWGFGHLMSETLAYLESQGVDVLAFRNEQED